MEGSPANFNEGDDQQTQHLILSYILLFLTLFFTIYFTFVYFWGNLWLQFFASPSTRIDITPLVTATQPKLFSKL